MAEASWPSPGHNTRAVSDIEYEQLTHPVGGDGVVGTPSDTTVVTADDSGMVVTIRADKFAVVRGRAWSSGSVAYTEAIGANASGLVRIDLVVLRLTRSTSAITTEVVAGTPGAGAPSLTQDLGTTGVYEIPLAEVSVPSGDASIAAAQVTRKEFYLGEPLIVCTSTTRPGHAPGRRIYETDTAIEQISTGASWVAAREDTGWVSASAATGWTTSPSGYIRVRRKDGWVFCAWLIFRSGATLSEGQVSTLFTVPAGYRPDQQHYGTFDVSGTGAGSVDFRTNGLAVISSYDSQVVNGNNVRGSSAWPL